LEVSSVVIHSPMTSTDTVLSLTFQYGFALPMDSRISLRMPSFTLIGTAAPTTQGCGQTNFTTESVSDSGLANAQITFRAGANLAANTICSIITATGMMRTPNQPQHANLKTRMVQFEDRQSQFSSHWWHISTSTQVDIVGTVSDDSLAIHTPYASLDTNMSLSFTYDQMLSTGATIRLYLPYFNSPTRWSPATTQGCGTSTVSGPQHGYWEGWTPTFSITFTVNGNMTANTPCTITTAVRTPTQAQAANLQTRMITFRSPDGIPHLQSNSTRSPHGFSAHPISTSSAIMDTTMKPMTFSCGAIKEAYATQQCCTRGPDATFSLPTAGSRRAEGQKNVMRSQEVLKKLETLSMLHKTGMLTDQEFQAQKKQVLNVILGLTNEHPKS